MGEGPLGIYVHIPFCTGKCPYCDFNSRPALAGEIDAYLASLEREMEARLGNSIAADTVYFGGGTPTLLTPSALGQLLAGVRRVADVAPDAEISIEANPESLTRDRLAELRRAGFNRLSIGAQSFDDRVLAKLGRRHDAARALEAIADARAEGWDNLSIDLIYAAPGQSVAQWKETLEQAIALRPEHVSAYCLTIEADTAFGRVHAAGGLATADEEVELEMYAATRQMLLAGGYEHYEISNFALPGRRCRHNEKYWQAADYIGVGAGAHSSVNGVRWANAARVETYNATLERGRLPVAYAERLSTRRRMDENLVLSLRTAEGASLPALGARCGRDAQQTYRKGIRQLAEAGLATTDGSRVALTERGMVLASEIAVLVMG